MAVWNQLTSEFHTAFDRIWLLQTNAPIRLSATRKSACRTPGTATAKGRSEPKRAGHLHGCGWPPAALVAGIFAIVVWLGPARTTSAPRDDGNRRRLAQRVGS